MIKILNWQLSKEKFTLEGSSGSLANAERESDFDPKLTNPSGGVADIFNGQAGTEILSMVIDGRMQVHVL